jgi:hypothetical protein
MGGIMTFISLNNLRVSNYSRLPLDKIIYRTRAHKNGKPGKIAIEILIPRQISTKAGIDNGTQVDILYDPEQKIVKIRLLKVAGGFCVTLVKAYGKKASKYPAKRVKIQTIYPEGCQLPITNNQNIFIEKFDISDGLNFSLESVI